MTVKLTDSCCDVLQVAYKIEHAEASSVFLFHYNQPLYQFRRTKQQPRATSPHSSTFTMSENSIHTTIFAELTKLQDVANRLISRNSELLISNTNLGRTNVDLEQKVTRLNKNIAWMAQEMTALILANSKAKNAEDYDNLYVCSNQPVHNKQDKNASPCSNGASFESTTVPESDSNTYTSGRISSPDTQKPAASHSTSSFSTYSSSKSGPSTFQLPGSPGVNFNFGSNGLFSNGECWIKSLHVPPGTSIDVSPGKVHIISGGSGGGNKGRKKFHSASVESDDDESL